MDGALPRHMASWRMAGNRHVPPVPFFVAGIVNITPDSFSDGGNFFAPEDACKRVRQVVDEGAYIVDLGPESTRPGARDIGHAEEWRRLKPVLEETLALRDSTVPRPVPGKEESAPAFAVSIDTFRAQTAALALASGAQAQGADIINDVSGGAFDPAMDEVLAQFKPGYILGHSPAMPQVMQHCPRYDNVVDEVLHWFTRRMTALVKAGLPEECICLDPCVGFGKNREHNLAVCAAAPRFAGLGRPLFYGVSRKSFLSSLLGESPHRLAKEPGRPCPDIGELDTATLTMVILLAKAGVAVHRVHQVGACVTALKLVRNMNMPGLNAGCGNGPVSEAACRT
jgi:dihydropteroate synthase